jgi:simple sugar transport system permease protein
MVAVTFGSILLAMVIGGIVLAVTGHNPFTTYHQIYSASISDHGALSQTLVSMTPLLFTGLAAAVAFRMRVWNIGGEGQLYMGALGAAALGLVFHDLPGPMLILLMVVGGVVAGSLWAAIPGALRAYFNTNEILVSLMLNYVARAILYYLIFDSTSYFRDLTSPAGKVFPQSKYLSESATWPPLTLGTLVIPLGLMMGVILAVLLWEMIRKTRYGFEMRVIGDSPRTAQYAGIKTRRKILSLMLLSGALAGLGGASQVGDFGHQVDPRGLEQSGFGYTGIVVAALARYNPLGVILTSFFIGAIINAGFALQGPGFPIGLTGTLEGILLFCVLGATVLTTYRVRFQRSRVPAEPPGSGPPVARPESAVVAGSAGGEAAP